MGLFGGGNSSTQANTTTNTTNTSTARDIGLTGQNAVDAIGYITNGAALSIRGMNESWDSFLGASSTAYNNQINNAYRFGGDTVQNVLQFADNAGARAENMLTNIFNLTRDVSQRSINASTGQATPLASVPSAGSASTNAIGGSDSTTNTVFLIAAIIAIVSFFGA